MSKIEPMYDGIKLNIAITSDNHIDIKSKANKKRIKMIKKVLDDVENGTQRFDAYITVGDTTSRGGFSENWELVKGAFEGTDPADNILFTIGNHDCWGEDGYEWNTEALANFAKYSKEICKNDIDKPYFSKVIKGYHFIFLGSDGVAENEDCADISEEQKAWFKAEMDEAAKSGKPVFVFCHQSVNTNHGLPRTWTEKEDPNFPPEIGGIGKDSDDIKKILDAHKNVYYFSGHSHMGLNGEKCAKKNGYSSYETHDGVHYYNLPCLTRPNHHGENEKTGQGLVIEVYESKVVIRPRNFLKKKMNKKVAVQDGKPFIEEEIL